MIIEVVTMMMTMMMRGQKILKKKFKKSRKNFDYTQVSAFSNYCLSTTFLLTAAL